MKADLDISDAPPTSDFFLCNVCFKKKHMDENWTQSGDYSKDEEEERRMNVATAHQRFLITPQDWK